MKIEKFKINNFRSLINFDITLGDTTILFGENNVGKSNVLRALHIIFSRKKKIDEGNNFSPPENFYEGVVENFLNNYFNSNIKNIIEFQITVLTTNELIFDDPILSLKKADSKYSFEIAGSFKPHPSNIDIGEIFLENVKLNGAQIYGRDKTGIAFFPSLDKDKVNQGPLAQAFTKLINPLNDCVQIINSERGMHEASFSTDKILKITPEKFKNFLHFIYLDKSAHHIFERINQLFNDDPFKFGSISFAKEGDNLEIMIKNGDLRLPIGDLGSSVLQTLYIITYIIYMKSRIICIEELEQNLSPKLQSLTLRKIQKMIASDGLNQIILSSHSSVYNKTNFGTIYLLEKEGNKTKATLEPAKVSDKMSKHFAPAHVEYTKEQFEEVKRILKDEHDFTM